MSEVTVTLPQLKEIIGDLHISWELSKAREAALRAENDRLRRELLAAAEMLRLKADGE